MAGIRDQLARDLPTRTCCRLAVLGGMTADLPKEGGRLVTGSAAVARALLLLAKEAGLPVERLETKSSLTLAVTRRGSAVPKRRCCRRSWLGGTFLIGGTLSDPQKGYNLEWTGSKELLEVIGLTLAAEGVRTGLYERTPGNWILYSRNAEDISTILAAIGATKALLALEEVRLEKELRNQVHRQVNYETANLQKAVDAGVRQAAEIARMRSLGLLDGLPESLLQAASLRERHPYASLVQLCEMADPLVSKSGMNHRLRKLHAIMRAHEGDSADADSP